MASELHDFSLENYNNSPAAAISSDLSPSEDIVTIQLGQSCRMPSIADIEELAANCTLHDTTLDGQAGTLCTSNINGNSIFIPKAGYIDGTNIVNANYGWIWASNYHTETNAARMRSSASELNTQFYSLRYEGLNIRPVKVTV